jgi:hypothetical protein
MMFLNAPFFTRNSKKNIRLFLILLTATWSSRIGAQQALNREFKWAEKGTYETIPDTFPDQDAILISKDIYFTVDWGIPGQETDRSSVFTHLKFKILNHSGLEKLGHLKLSSRSTSHIRTLDARIIHADGAVLDLNAKDIHENLDEIPEGEQNVPHRRIFSVTGASPGDEIEIVLLERIEGVYIYHEGFLNDESSFCLHSRYTQSMPVGFETNTKCYNNMPIPRVDTVKGQRIISWQATNLPALRAEECSNPFLEYPFIRYSLKNFHRSKAGAHGKPASALQSVTGTWFEIGRNIMNRKAPGPGFVQSRISKHFHSLFENYLTYSLNPDTLQRISRFFNYVDEHVQVIDVSEEEYENSIDAYLSKNQLTAPLLFYLFDRMFQELNLNYFLGFAKNRSTGYFDPDFINVDMATNEFMGFELKNHFYYFFLSYKTHDFRFGEVPVGIAGTDAILVSKNTVDSPVRKFSFPLTDAQRNFSKTNVFLNIDLKKKRISRVDRNTQSGSVTSAKRDDLLLESKGTEALLAKKQKEETAAQSGFTADSIKILTAGIISPFPFTTELTFQRSGGIHTLDTITYSIPLSGIIRPELLEYSGKKRKTVYYPKYLYADVHKIYLVFENKVELMNSDQCKGAWTGSIGSYSLKATQVTETTLLIESNYEVSAASISAADYTKIGELNAEAMKALSLQVVVRSRK